MSRTALAPGHAREYDTIYIMRPNVERDDADDVAGRVADAIRGHNGALTSAELWGRRRLAYPIERHHRGVYVYVKYLGHGDTVAELERQLRLVDSVIRYQTIMVRSNVLVEEVTPDESALKLDFEMPSEPDEPELTRERELGLDGSQTERRRPRRDEDDMDDDEEDVLDEESADRGGGTETEEES
jgi:small subunit ribosomal protein S6